MSNLEQPALRCIRIEYSDGSLDYIENNGMPYYLWTRMRLPDRGETLKTSSAIAALLFQTALAGHLTEYDINDPKTRKLLKEHVKFDRDGNILGYSVSTNNPQSLHEIENQESAPLAQTSQDQQDRNSLKSERLSALADVNFKFDTLTLEEVSAFCQLLSIGLLSGTVLVRYPPNLQTLPHFINVVCLGKPNGTVVIMRNPPNQHR